ncbi:MAG: M48 family metallopeptidase [Planctomycetaceae bacterium]|nr:M48 family metallopeptidase [Planctomycetaceae bacterium]
MALNYRDFIHPEDEIAIQRLDSVIGFKTITKLVMNLIKEQRVRSECLTEMIRLSPTQLPKIYNLLPPICQKFGITVPEFYLQSGDCNAYTYGDDQNAIIVIKSGLLNQLKDEKAISAVLAHECGHIFCRHTFYKTVANYIANSANLLPLGQVALGPIQLALAYWSRRSELSADRAALIYSGDSESVIRYLIVFAGGSAAITKYVNMEEFAAQAELAQKIHSGILQKSLDISTNIIQRSHPFPSERVYEILKWEKSEQYQRLRAVLNDQPFEKSCQHCNQTIQIQAKFCRFCGQPQS